jgi:flagellar biosynthesis/type III secretory pathway chaperone
MNAGMRAAAERLAEVLDHENGALERGDAVAAAACLADKKVAIDALEQCRDAPDADDGASCPADVEAARALARRLVELGDRNKLLLEQALAVQNRVMAVLVAAARDAMPRRPYGNAAVRRTTAPSVAIAVNARA